MNRVGILAKVRGRLPLFYAHLFPMLIVLALLKLLILTRFLVDPGNGLFHPVAKMGNIIFGVLLETLPVTVLLLFFFFLFGMGRFRRTLLALQGVLMVVDIAGLYFFSINREWFSFEDFHLLRGASFSSAGDLISAEVPLLLVLVQTVLAVAGFLLLYRWMARLFAKKFSPCFRGRSRTRLVAHSYLVITLIAGVLNFISLPLFGRSGIYGNTAVTRFVGSLLQEQFATVHDPLASVPPDFNYRWVRGGLYRTDDFAFPDPGSPFLRTPRVRDRLHSGAIARPGRYNVVFFVLESLSAHVIGARHKGRAIAPSLAALSRRGLSFSRFYTTGFPSARGQESIFYSLYPPVIDGYGIKDHPEISFVQRLRSRGYRTGCFSASFYQPLRSAAFFKRSGHEFYRYPGHYGIRPKMRIAAETQMLEKMYRHILSLDRSKPFMMTFLSEIGHIPYWYYPFDSKIGMLFPHDKTTESRYATQVHFIGELVARFIRRVERHPAFRNTVFVIVGDHRPHKELDYSYYTGKKIAEEDYWHQHPLIPFILYAPGIVRRVRAVETRPGGQVDIGPTILQLTGIPQTTSRWFGQSLIRRHFNYDRYIMLHKKHAVYDNRVINENGERVQKLPVPAGSVWSGRIPDSDLFNNYRRLRRCLNSYRSYYRDAVRLKPAI